VVHRVNESVLKELMELSGIDSGIADRIRGEISELRDEGADAVVCKCSSTGVVAEEMNDSETIEVQRIDRAMADTAVGIGERIVLAASLPSTLGPTRKLLKSSSLCLGKSISIQEVVIPSAWALYEAGDQAGYFEEIAKAMTAEFEKGDVIVLAQASMAGAVSLVLNYPTPILSSPKLGVDRAVEALRESVRSQDRHECRSCGSLKKSGESLYWLGWSQSR
jgi:hypothetical protein